MTPSRVLVVDDSFENRLVAAGHLKAAGFLVDVVDGGLAALAHIESTAVDLIVLDVRMPDLDGYEVCRRMRANPATADVPVLFLSALGDRDTTEPAIAAGGDDILSKPFCRGELLMRVRALIRQGKTLAELRAVTAKLSEQNVALRRLEQHRRDTAALLAHDIKGPLMAVLGNAECLRTTTLDTHQAEIVDDIHGGAVRASTMIRDLLDINSSDDGALAPRAERIQVADLFADVAMLLRGLARGARVEIRVATEAPSLVADRPILGRVLENLAINAIKYAPAGSDILLSASRRTDGVVLGVHDSGPGVSTEQATRIFEKYTTGDPSHLRNGHGLGLVFCRLAVEAHGGRIWVDARIGGGASFYVHLPQPEGATAPIARHADDVLVVDDESLSRNLIARSLRGTCTVDAISSGQEALERFRAGARYALVLCDVAMPGVNGLDVLEVLRREADDQVERFVFVTGGARTPADELRLATCGVPILQKPFDRASLVAFVRERLGGATVEREQTS